MGNKVISNDLFEDKSKDNKITLIYKIEKPGENIRLFGTKFIEKNKDKCLLCIDFVVKNLVEFYQSKKNKSTLKVVLALKANITDLSYMFNQCSSLISLPDLYNLKLNNLTNISNMFSGCTSLKSLSDISKWDTKNISNMSNLFNECSSLEELPDISNWNTTKVTNMEKMFYFLISLNSLPDISKWNIKNAVNISSMFSGCSNLKSLPDISKWNTKNINNISYLFCRNSSLKILPEISKWKTNQVTDMSYLFYGCSSLTSIPDISIWETEKVTDMSYMFYKCSSLKLLPSISKWKTNNVINMSYIFHGCSLLTSLDDISKWNTDKVIDINNIFSNCPLLSPLPNISKWKCNKNKNINENDGINKIKVKGEIYNDNLKFIPQIEMKFNDFNKYEANIVHNLREEIKNLLKTDNFSIVEIKRGSLTILLTLQCLILKELKEMGDQTRLSESFFENMNDDAANFKEKLLNHNFISLGSVKPNYVDVDIMDINDEDNKKKITQDLLRVARNNDFDDENFIEEAKNFDISKDDLKKYFNNLSLKADEQEKNVIEFIERLDEFNQVFDKEIEMAFKKSIFEYKITHIFVIDNENNIYVNEKNKCPNRETRILFHGTNVNAITSIFSTRFNQGEGDFGYGIYFTDILDYAWYYGGRTNRENFGRIPKVGNYFTCIANEIYYDKTKIQKKYNCVEKKVPKNAIRKVFVNYDGDLLNESQLENYKGFIGNEYIITDESQILPLYGITFKRVEYLVIWRDYNFNPENPNNYSIDVFDEIQEFHRVIKKYLARELNSKIYYIESNEEALELLNRKKYNKVIIITNGNNNGQEFILKARRIIGANSIAAVTAYNINAHINWVQNLQNVLILNGFELHKNFFKCIKMKDINLYKQLKEEINKEYNSNLLDYPGDLFNFPNFKIGGCFRDLNFVENENADLGMNMNFNNNE